MHNKILRSILALIIIFFSTALFPSDVPADSLQFIDVTDPTAPYYKAVYRAAKNNYAKGFSDGHFGLDESCTRAQFVIFIWRLAGMPETAEVTNTFSDVNKKTSGYKAIMWAVNKSIISGYKDGTYRPDEPVQRRHAAIMLWRMAGKPLSDGLRSFSDVLTGNNCRKAVLWGSEKGFD